MRTEFKSHLKVTNPEQVNQFIRGWEQYLFLLKSREGPKVGINMDSSYREALNEDQIARLKDLHVEVTQKKKTS